MNVLADILAQRDLLSNLARIRDFQRRGKTE